MSSLIMRHSFGTTKSFAERYLIISYLHTSSPRSYPSRPKRKHGSSAPPSRTQLVKDLKPKSRNSGRLVVASESNGDRRPSNKRQEDTLPVEKKPDHRSPLSKSHKAAEPPRSTTTFARDALPHEGVAPVVLRRRVRRKGAEALKDMPPIPTSSSTMALVNWAARAHAERTERRAAERFRRASRPPVNPLGNEFNTSKVETTITTTKTTTTKIDELPHRFTSPPLIEGLLTCLKETIPPNAKPTPIQALSLKYLFRPKESENAWRQYLLASETGSGKSIAYLLPLLQDLKRSEDARRPPPPNRCPINPRALILAPTHELSRQLSSFAKSLLHVSKLRVLCTSQANVPSTPRTSGTASKMAKEWSDYVEVADGEEGSSEFEVRRSTSARPVDVLVGTLNKVLEMERGRGWDWEERQRERMEREIEEYGRVEHKGRTRPFWTAQPELGLAGIEWVVVDEADILLDPDFQESTRMLLSDIALARGHSVPFELNTNPDTPPTPIKYPFNLVLTTATIPSSLASYLDTYHPDLTRLASPNLHHLPRSLKTEYVDWTGGNRNSDVESRIRRVWAEDSLRGKNGQLGPLSKVLIFCNKRSKVEDLSSFLTEKNIKNVALTGTADSRKRGSNHHLDGFLRTKTKALTVLPDDSSAQPPAAIVPKTSADSKDPKKTPHIMITTSLLSRGLDFSPDIKHVFIVDEPRNMIDFLHRAGRSGRAGQKGKVVVFGKMSGRGSALAKEIRTKVRALVA